MAAPIDPARPSPGDQRRMSQTSHTSSRSSNPKPMTPRSNGTLESAAAWNASVSQPMYSPQFSAATSLILDRIRNEPRGFSSALSDASAGFSNADKSAYETARSKVVQGMNMSTTASMSPATPQSQSKQKSSTPDTFEKRAPTEIKSETQPGEEAMNPGIKRKREADERVDFTQNTMVMPPTKPIPVRRAPPKPSADPYGRVRSDPDRQQRIEQIRKKRLARLPEDVAPHKPELVGFDAKQASDYARGEYFGNMKKTDVLNLISFCDQLCPDLLIDLMVSVTKRHPDLPVFNSPDWDANIQEPARPQVHRPKPKPGGPRHGPSLLNSKAKHKIKSRPPAAKKPRKRSQLAHEVYPEEEAEEYEEEDTMPTTWPKAGEGMYAKLPPETEDYEFLVDGNDEEAFSHFMVDGMGRQIIDPV